LDYFAAGANDARAIVAAEIEGALDRLFARARRNVPAFLDEYYSLRGEYARAAISLGALVGLAEPDKLEARAASMLLPEDEWVDALARVDTAIAGRLDANRERLRAGWLAQISARLENRRVPQPFPWVHSAGPPLVLDEKSADTLGLARSA